MVVVLVGETVEVVVVALVVVAVFVIDDILYLIRVEFTKNLSCKDV